LTTRSGVRRTLTALAVAAGSLNAQAAPAKCTLPLESNGKLLLALQVFNGMFKPNATQADKAKALTGTMRAITDDVTGFPANMQASRNFLVSQVLLSWMQEPGTGLVEPRGKLGYTANPTGTHDIAASIDTAFRAIRVAKPECTDSLKIYTQGVWGTLINKAVTYTNAQQLDSAETFARASMQFDDKQYYAYNIMASIAMTKDDTAGMVEWFQKTADVTAASKDTNALKVRDAMLLNLGALFGNAAVDAEGAKKAELNAKAVAVYQKYLGYYPNDLTTKLRILRMSETKLDSAAASKFVDEVLANPGAVSDAQLTEAGNFLTDAPLKFYTAGLRLFDEALKKNPNSRDALYNSAVAMNNLERFDAITPLFTRLRSIDPNNLGIYSLARNVQSARKLAVQTRANKGVRPRAGQQVMLNPAQQAQIKVFNDSLVYYTKLAQDMTPTVEVRSFSPVDGGVKMGALVQVPPDKPAAAFTLVVEFLDATGNAVATQNVTTKQIAPGGFEAVSVDGKGAGIVAFRYRVQK
jgi:tetratricopeptide (TPR) repeat protein